MAFSGPVLSYGFDVLTDADTVVCEQERIAARRGWEPLPRMAAGSVDCPGRPSRSPLSLTRCQLPSEPYARLGPRHHRPADVQRLGEVHRRHRYS